MKSRKGPGEKFQEGRRVARFRWDAAMRRDDVAVCLQLPSSASVPAVVCNARRQRPYVSVCPDNRGQLREWECQATPVAPHPCMLCDAGFATRCLWEQHVIAQHVSVSWYRQRLHYLAGRFDAVKPVMPQQWRFLVESYSEDFTSGTASWPLCGEDEDWDGDFSLQHLTKGQYHHCACELTKVWSEYPWRPEARTGVDLAAFALETLAPILRASVSCPATVAGTTDDDLVRLVNEVISVMRKTGRILETGGQSLVPRPEDVVRVWAWVLLEGFQGEGVHAEETICDSFSCVFSSSGM